MSTEEALKSVCGHRLQKEVDTEQLHADGLTMGKGADIFALVSRGHRSDRIPLGRALESPRHFAASMDESVIVGYYTLKSAVLQPSAVCKSQRKENPMARNDGIDRTVARNQDLETPADVAKVQEHNEREKDSYSNQDIVPERTALNVHFKVSH